MKTEPTFADPHAFYDRLVRAQEGLTEEQREFLMNSLVLLMANQVGDDTVLAACIDEARSATLDNYATDGAS